MKLDAVGQWDLRAGFNDGRFGRPRDETMGPEWNEGWIIGRRQFLEANGFKKTKKIARPRFAHIPAIQERLRVGKRAA